MNGNGVKLIQEINKTTEAVIGAAIEVRGCLNLLMKNACVTN